MRDPLFPLMRAKAPRRVTGAYALDEVARPLRPTVPAADANKFPQIPWGKNALLTFGVCLLSLLTAVEFGWLGAVAAGGPVSWGSGCSGTESPVWVEPLL